MCVRPCAHLFDCRVSFWLKRATIAYARDAPFHEKRDAEASLIANAIVDVLRWRERLRRVGLEPLEMQVTVLHHKLMLLKLQHTMRHA